jgi:putative pyruvate formate lyase activating enzyme
MPGQSAETEQICRWLAEEVSRDTYINIMGQYRPAYQVGQIGQDGAVARYAEIDRRPGSDEIARAYEAARRVGLCRFDQYW